ncbi:glycosyltransferase [Nereida ignava]|uniref:glycosyltransferase n=1 Tax=Nereida ignava TaxID=282199 RepID=UPI002FDF8C27
MTPKSIILHIVRNKVIEDSRVLRAAKAVAQAFPNAQVTCLGYTNDSKHDYSIGSVKLSIVKVSTWPLMPKIISRFMKYLHWHYECVKEFSDKPVKVIHCHELVPILISLHLKYRTGCKIIYDAHELETECRTNRFDKSMKFFYKLVEKVGINSASTMITVSNSIRDWYSEKYPRAEINVIYNCPEVSVDTQTTTPIQVLNDDVSFIYCGAIVPGRGIDLYLQTFAEHPDKMLYFLGDGTLVETVKQFSAKYKNIEYLGKVKPDQVVNALKIADVSLCLIEDTTLTSRYCMPNKLFESAVAGLPLIVSDLPDLREFIETHDAGWVTDYEKSDLGKVISSLNKADISAKSQNLSDFDQLFSWDAEQYKLIDIYTQLLEKEMPL